MSKLLSVVKTFVDDENGVTAIEYGLIAALIGVAIAVAAGTVGTKVTAAFDYVKDHIIIPAA
ncbi:MAG TPA: Flp family type IVb pilin [Telluria sp.]